jgi:hypothetical protein
MGFIMLRIGSMGISRRGGLLTLGRCGNRGGSLVGLSSFSKGIGMGMG